MSVPQQIGRVRGALGYNVDLLAPLEGEQEAGVVVGATDAPEDWLLYGQDDATENGIYTIDVEAGIWQGHDPGFYRFGDWLWVMEGEGERAWSRWIYSGVDNPEIGVTSKSFVMREPGTPIVPGVGFEARRRRRRAQMEMERNSAVGGSYDHGIPLPDRDGGIRSVDQTEGRDGYMVGGDFEIQAGGFIQISRHAAWFPESSGVWGLPSTQTLDIGLVSGATMRHFYLQRVYDSILGRIASIVVAANDEPLEHYSDYDVKAKALSDVYPDFRYLSSARAPNSSGEIFCQFHDSQTGLVFYLENTSNSPWRLASNAGLGSNTTFSIGVIGNNLVPRDCRFALLRVVSGGNQRLVLTNSDAVGTSPQAGSGLVQVSANTTSIFLMPLDSAGQFIAATPATSGTFTIDVIGYVLRR